VYKIEQKYLKKEVQKPNSTNFDKLHNLLCKVHTIFYDLDAAGKCLSDCFKSVKPLKKVKEAKIKEELKMFFVNLEVYGSFNG